MVDKVMVFCQKYNIVGFTDNEYTKRILYPGPLYQSRYAYTRSVYVIHERGSSVVVRVFDGFYKCWRRVMTVTNELPQKYYGIAFAANKLFIIGGRTETGTFLKDVRSNRPYSMDNRVLPLIPIYFRWTYLTLHQGLAPIYPPCSSLVDSSIHLWSISSYTCSAVMMASRSEIANGSNCVGLRFNRNF